MTDTLAYIGPNGIAPPPFPARRFAWVHCEIAVLEGFAIEVRTNLLNRERFEFMKAWRTIADHEKWWLEQQKAWAEEHPGEVMPEYHSLATDTPAKRVNALIAPYVRAWNAMGLVEGPDGELTEAPVPAPADGGPDVFLLVEDAMRDWVVGRVLGGYLSGKGIRPSSGASKPSPAPSDGPSDPR